MEDHSHNCIGGSYSGTLFGVTAFIQAATKGAFHMASRAAFAPVLLLLLIQFPLTAFADDDAVALKAQNDRLMASNIRLAKENADLRAEIAKMQADSAKAGATGAQPADARTGVSDANKSTDANAAICKAFHKYTESVAAIQTDDTDILKRQKWFDAAKELDAVLAKNRATITCTVSNVGFDPHAQAEVATGKEWDLGLKHQTGGVPAAKIIVGTVTLKSNDQNILDVTFNDFVPINIGSTEAEAEKITTSSTMTLEGNLSLGFDLKRPTAEQPVIKNATDCILVGSIDDPATRIWSMRPQSMQMRSTATLEIDGIKRKIYGSTKTSALFR